MFACPYGEHNHRFDSERGRKCARRNGAEQRRRAAIVRRPTQKPPQRKVLRQPSMTNPRRPTENRDSSSRPNAGAGFEAPVTTRRAARDHLTVAPDVDGYILSYVFDRDGFYEKLADKLIDNLPESRRGPKRDHWLCLQLSHTADLVNPDTYAEQAGKTVRDGLAGMGFPKFMADALGAGSGVVLKVSFGSTPLGSVTKVLYALIPLVCPELERCPTEKKVVQTFATPILAEQLRRMAEG